AVRLLLLDDGPARLYAGRAGRDDDGQLDPLPERPGHLAAEQVEGDAGQVRAAEDRDAAATGVARPAPDGAALHRPALVDVQHEVLPQLLLAEELLRRSDLHDVPRQRALVHPDQPGRTGRSV